MRETPSNEIERIRRRLAALDSSGVETAAPSSKAALARCRSAQRELRELKRRVLDELVAVRRDVQEQAWSSLAGPRPSMRELWERRDEGARRLLQDVRRRVIGLVDREDAAALESWAEVNEEIDARLERLEERERRLALAVEPGVGSLPERRSADGSETADDDLYAAVGAAVQKGVEAEGFCPHCGQAVEEDDRFCRRCGHSLIRGE